MRASKPVPPVSVTLSLIYELHEPLPPSAAPARLGSGLCTGMVDPGSENLYRGIAIGA